MADNNIMDEIFKSIDIITDHKLELTEYVYTEDCIIIGQTSDPVVYKIQHQGQEFDAYSPLGEVFSAGESVIVLFTDYSKITKKIILFGSNHGVRRLSETAFSDTLHINATGSFDNGVIYGTSNPMLVFGFDTSLLGGATTGQGGKSYSAFSSPSISINNPLTGEDFTALQFQSFFADSYAVNLINISKNNRLVLGTNDFIFNPLDQGYFATVFGYDYGQPPLSNNPLGTAYTFGTGVIDNGSNTNGINAFWYRDPYTPYLGGSRFIGKITTLDGNSITMQSPSDYRLKEDILPLENTLDKINLLNPISFNWKTNKSKADGFIAHEVKDIFPRAVSGEKDGVNDKGEPAYQMLDESKLIPYLVKAVQELSEQVSILKNEIQILKGGS